MSVFSSDANDHPHREALRLRQLLAESDARARARVPGQTTSARRRRPPGPGRTMRVSHHASPREPWFGKAYKASARFPNALLCVDEQSAAPMKRPGHDLSASQMTDFKSLALECEWRLREAVEQRAAGQVDKDLVHLDPLFIQACCKILGDLAPACGPVAKLLRDLTAEFERHIFIPATESGILKHSPNTSGPLTYFSETERLKSVIESSVQERSALRNQVSSVTRECDVLRAELKRMQRSVADTEAALREAKQNISSIVKIAEHARDGYHRVREDNDALTKELQETKRDSSDRRAAFKQQAKIYAIQISQLKNELKRHNIAFSDID